MSKKCTLVLGGARSGKSRFAQTMAGSISNRVLFVATAEPLDADMRQRIENHRNERPESWRTLEMPMNIADEIERQAGDSEVVLIDCLTLLVSNIMLGEGRGFAETDDTGVDETARSVEIQIESIKDAMDRMDVPFIVVSNELGLGLVPENRQARIYRDVLGRANQLMAEYADEVYFMIAGIPMKVKG